MQTPYQNIGEANEYSAFITGHDGHDKAVINRYDRELPDDHPLLDDDEWQRLTYLIDAAPKLLEALHKAQMWMACEDDYGMNGHDRDVYKETMEAINAAIDLATKGRP
jgi:hypothetical protein